MKDIRIKESCSGLHFSFKKGEEVYLVEDRLANDLINAGYAEDITKSTSEPKKTTAKKATTKKSNAKKEVE